MGAEPRGPFIDWDCSAGSVLVLLEFFSTQCCLSPQGVDLSFELILLVGDLVAFDLEGVDLLVLDDV